MATSFIHLCREGIMYQLILSNWNKICSCKLYLMFLSSVLNFFFFLLKSCGSNMLIKNDIHFIHCVSNETISYPFAYQPFCWTVSGQYLAIIDWRLSCEGVDTFICLWRFGSYFKCRDSKQSLYWNPEHWVLFY